MMDFKTMTLNQAVAYFGSQAKVAEALGLVKANVTLFKGNGGIPFNHQCTLEKLSAGKLQAQRENDPANPFYKDGKAA